MCLHEISICTSMKAKILLNRWRDERSMDMHELWVLTVLHGYTSIDGSLEGNTLSKTQDARRDQGPGH